MNVSDYKKVMTICGKAGLTLMAWGRCVRDEKGHIIGVTQFIKK